MHFSKDKQRSFWNLSLKKDRSSSSLDGHQPQAQSATTTNHHHAHHNNDTHNTHIHNTSHGSSSSTEVSDVEHMHEHQDHHNFLHNSHQEKNHKDKDDHGHSMLELKRFFKKTSKISSSSSLKTASNVNLSNSQDPFDEDGVLARKYGSLGKVLGSGAGGSVRLLTRPSDGITFAVKEFRARRPNEQMKDYVKKCTSEFSIGSTLHHPNVIKTLDIAHFDDHYYEVMEYCPIDFFAVVMSGKMNRGEINCCFRQMCEGVKYIHSMGLAHRDLKLDNCVINSNGILKIIDFGSAVVFRFPYEKSIVKAHGVVGSDPYMAPEVYSPDKYDPQPVDIWSLAIIYCCMTIKRFPWKVPRQTDKSFKLYCLPDDRPHDYVQAAKIHRDLQIKRREERLQQEANESKKAALSNPNKSENDVDKITEVLNDASISKKEPKGEEQTDQMRPAQSMINESDVNLSETIRKIEQRPKVQDNHTVHGPYRLMRLLPHAARPLISHMLTVNPEKRATMKDIFEDEWFNEIRYCTEDAKGNPVNAPGHSHTFVKEEEAHLEAYKEKKETKR